MSTRFRPINSIDFIDALTPALALTEHVEARWSNDDDCIHVQWYRQEVVVNPGALALDGVHGIGDALLSHLMLVAPVTPFEAEVKGFYVTRGVYDWTLHVTGEQRETTWNEQWGRELAPSALQALPASDFYAKYNGGILSIHSTSRQATASLSQGADFVQEIIADYYTVTEDTWALITGDPLSPVSIGHRQLIGRLEEEINRPHIMLPVVGMLPFDITKGK